MKKKQINKVKVNIFEEKELRERLGLNKEQINLILKYQERFPELLQETKNNKFLINARNLYKQLVLNVKKNKKGTEFARWIKRRIIKYKFKENEDFLTVVKFNERENTNLKSKKIEYLLTLNMAKELCMVENNDIGLETRKYFILMEDTLRNYKNWNASRNSEKDGWNSMSQCIEDWCKRKGYDYTLRRFYTREANLLNISLLNYPAIEINDLLNNKDEITRNHLFQPINDALNFLQQLNCSLLMADLDFQTRSNIIKTTCENKYSNLKELFNKSVA